MVERLAYDANHDALTGLPNRAAAVRRIAAARRRPHGAAVLLLDLDRFKEVNDALGHAAGDRLLSVVAERLRGASAGRHGRPLRRRRVRGAPAGPGGTTTPRARSATGSRRRCRAR